MKQIRLTCINVFVISYILLGYKSGKGMYADKVKDIVKPIMEQGNILSSITVPDGKNVIKRL